MVWFQCQPVEALWDPALQNHCNHKYNVNYTYFVGAVAAVSDLILAIVPSYMLWPLKIDRKVKCGLGVLLGTGVVAAAAAVVRSWAAKFILEKDSSCKLILPSVLFSYAHFTHSTANTKYADGIGILFRWGEVEEWLVIICMSIPPVWPLFRPYCERFLNLTSQNASRFKSSRQSGISGNTTLPQSKNSDLEQRFGSHGRSTESHTVLKSQPQIFRLMPRENSEFESKKGIYDWTNETEEWTEWSDTGTHQDHIEEGEITEMRNKSLWVVNI